MITKGFFKKLSTLILAPDVIPAKAGTYYKLYIWIPACAGMTIMFHDVIKQIGLNNPKIIKKNLKGNYFAIKGQINKQDVLLKITFKDDTERIKRLYKEKLVSDFINKGVAKVIDFGQNEKYVWIVRRYYPGQPLANDPVPKTPLFSHKISREEYLNGRTELVSRITKNLAAFRNININQKLFPRRFEKNLVLTGDRHIDLIKSELGIDLSRQLKFYNSIKKQYLDKENIKPCTSDLTPTNIIVTKNQVVFSDLEWFCFDNYTVDMATLWLYLWRDPDWQKDFLSNNIKTKKDQDFFRASLIREIIYWYKLTMNLKFNDEARFIERKNQLKKHVWTKYLVAAGQSYEAITKIDLLNYGKME